MIEPTIVPDELGSGLIAAGRGFAAIAGARYKQACCTLAHFADMAVNRHGDTWDAVAAAAGVPLEVLMGLVGDYPADGLPPGAYSPEAQALERRLVG